MSVLQRKGGLGLAAAATLLALFLAGCTTGGGSGDGGGDVPSGDGKYDGVVEGEGTGLMIGYISLGDSVPFVKLVSDNIREQVEASGAEFVFCDSQLDAAKALACAQNFKTQQVDGIINFQVDAAASAEICAAGPDVPVVAVDIHQVPCEKVFMGADNHAAGVMAGEQLGNYFQENFNCEYDAFVSLEQPAAGQVNTDRAGGAIEGFESVCGDVPADKLRQLDGGGTIDGGQTIFRDTLTALTGATRIASASLNDDMMLGAFAAADQQGRADQLFGVAQGADPSSWEDIQNNPNWVGDTAYFPERYGRIAVPAVIALIKGEDVPKELFTKHVFINKDNFAEFYG
jgi:ribose transport system substrate-binding protein